MELSHLASSVIRHANDVEEGDIGNSQPSKVKKPIRALVFSCCVLMLVTILVLTDMLCSFFTNLASNEEFLTKLSSILQACNNQSLHSWHVQNGGKACPPLPNM